MAKKIDVNGLDHYHDKVSAMVADEYSSSATYAVGDYCFHAGTLYKCTTAITTAENWTSGHWTAAKLAEDTSELKNAVDAQSEQIGEGGFTADIKTALLQIAQKVVYIDEHGQDYYNDLYEALYPESKDTTVVVETEGYVYDWNSVTQSERLVEKTYGGITKKYSIPSTTTLYPAGIIPYSNTTFDNSIGIIIIYNENDVIVNHVSMMTTPANNRWAQLASGTLTEFSQSWTVEAYTKILFCVDTRYVDDAYMYDKTTGLVFFAGKNTPYYGMKNISEASI